MFRFSAQGRIGSINQHRNNTLSISIAAERLANGRDGSFTLTEWMRCVSFDPALNKQMLIDLEKGQTVLFEGRMVPRVRDKNATTKIYDTTLEITAFKRISKPKAKAEKPATEAADAAAA
jgi:single-stranded DNA-binding protein